MIYDHQYAQYFYSRLDYFNLSNSSVIKCDRTKSCWLLRRGKRKKLTQQPKRLCPLYRIIEILVSDKSCHKSPVRLGDKTDKTPEMSK